MSDSPTNSLLFATPTFPSPGNSFTTVRIGDKWLKPTIGTRLGLYRADEEGAGTLFGIGILEGRFEGALEFIPNYFLGLNHDPKCRQLVGLVEGLADAYGMTTVADALDGNGNLTIVTLLIKVESLEG